MKKKKKKESTVRGSSNQTTDAHAVALMGPKIFPFGKQFLMGPQRQRQCQPCSYGSNSVQSRKDRIFVPQGNADGALKKKHSRLEQLEISRPAL